MANAPEWTYLVLAATSVIYIYIYELKSDMIQDDPSIGIAQAINCPDLVQILGGVLGNGTIWNIFN